MYSSEDRMITNADLWTKIIALFRHACTVMNLPEYVVKKGAQHTMGGFVQPLILINKIGSTNLSWGGEEYNYQETQEKLYRIEQLLQEVSFQVTALRRDSADDYNSPSDAVMKLQLYLNGNDGIAKAKELGIQLGRITNARHPIWVDEGKAYESAPSFDLTVYMKQEIEMLQEGIDEIVNQIGGI